MEKVSKMTQQLRQQERTAAMGRLAAGIAHEIRNPLNAIQILVQRMEREIAPSAGEENKFKEFTRIIREEIKRLNEIVKQFLEFSSTKQPDFTKCNPGKIAGDIVMLESGVAKQKNICILLNIEKDISEIEADAPQLKQALVNVIKNAIEAMSEGGEIIISVFQKNKKTYFVIEDSGEGMSEEKLEKAFDLYYSTKDHGTGLGLAITRRIIDAHNGEISISKREPEGVVVTIVIPNRRKSEHTDNR
jgi:signal transduction histidine kinase